MVQPSIDFLELVPTEVRSVQAYAADRRIPDPRIETAELRMDLVHWLDHLSSFVVQVEDQKHCDFQTAKALVEGLVRDQERVIPLH